MTIRRSTGFRHVLPHGDPHWFPAQLHGPGPFQGHEVAVIPEENRTGLADGGVR